MIINKNSWHYRLLRSSIFLGYGMEVSPPRNLCSYARWLVGSLLLLAMMFVMVCITAFMLGLAVYTHPVLTLSIMALIGAPFVIIAYGGWRKLSQTSTVKLAGEFWEAKTRGICPLVEYKDGDEQ